MNAHRTHPALRLDPESFRDRDEELQFVATTLVTTDASSRVVVFDHDRDGVRHTATHLHDVDPASIVIRSGPVDSLNPSLGHRLRIECVDGADVRHDVILFMKPHAGPFDVTVQP